MTGKQGSHDYKDLAGKTAKVRPCGMQVTLSHDQINDALDRLAAGDSMLHVTTDLKVSRNALHKRACVDCAFGESLRMAMMIGTHALLENAVDAPSGGEHSTGSERRDIAFNSRRRSNVPSAGRDPDYGHRCFVHQSPWMESSIGIRGSISIGRGGDRGPWRVAFAAETSPRDSCLPI